MLQRQLERPPGSRCTKLWADSETTAGRTVRRLHAEGYRCCVLLSARQLQSTGRQRSLKNCERQVGLLAAVRHQSNTTTFPTNETFEGQPEKSTEYHFAEANHSTPIWSRPSVRSEPTSTFAPVSHSGPLHVRQMLDYCHHHLVTQATELSSRLFCLNTSIMMCSGKRT